MEGPIIVREAIGAGLSISDVFLRADDSEALELRVECESAGAAVVVVGDAVLRAVADAATPQGVVAVARMPGFSLDQLSPAADLVLVLSQVRDPGNAGTLVRSAAAAGADCVAFSEGCVDPFGPKTVRGAAGSLFRVPVARAVPMAGALAALGERGFSVLGAEGTSATSLYDLDLTKATAIVVGNEARGLEAGIRELLADTASIPMAHGVESLNVASAGTLFLFEAVRQRRLSSAPDG